MICACYHAWRKRASNLRSHVYDELIEGLEKPIAFEEKEVPDVELLSSLDLASTPHELLNKAMSKYGLHMLNEAPLTEAMKA